MAIACIAACDSEGKPQTPWKSASDAGRTDSAVMADSASDPTTERSGAVSAAATGCATFDSSFAAIQTLIFERRGCTASQCHGEANAGKLDLRAERSHENLVDARASSVDMARVQPGTANESLLYLKLKAATEPNCV